MDRLIRICKRVLFSYIEDFYASTIARCLEKWSVLENSRFRDAIVDNLIVRLRRTGIKRTVASVNGVLDGSSSVACYAGGKLPEGSVEQT